MEVPSDDVKAIEQWGKENPFVSRIWLYGSRVTGLNRQESDLDIAIEHDALPGDSDQFTTAISEISIWQQELQSVTSVMVDVQSYIPGESEIVEQAIADASILIYERSRPR